MSLINRVNFLKMAKFGVVKGRSDKELFLPRLPNVSLEYGPVIGHIPQIPPKTSKVYPPSLHHLNVSTTHNISSNSLSPSMIWMTCSVVCGGVTSLIQGFACVHIRNGTAELAWTLTSVKTRGNCRTTDLER